MRQFSYLCLPAKTWFAELLINYYMNISLPKRACIAVLFLACVLFVSGQEKAFIEGKLSPYTAQFISFAKQAENDSVQQNRLQQRFGVKRLEERNYASAYIELNEGAALEVFDEYDVEWNMLVPGIASARIPVENIEAVSLLPEVKRVEMAIPVYQRMDKARPAANVDKVQAGEGLDMPYKGTDVVVGVIDLGLQYNHINFYDETGKNLRVKRVWNQNVRRGNAPEGYSYGEEYKTADEIVSAVSDGQFETHGTHVTGIAAGADNRNGNEYYGIATESDIVLVSYDVKDQDVFNNVIISDGVKYIYDYASSVGKPCVINISLGTHIGPHDGTSTFDRVCDGLQGKGRLLVGAAGNEHTDEMHVSKTFSPTDKNLNTFFTFRDENKLFGIADIWGEAGKKFTIKVVVYNPRKGEVFTTPVMDATAHSFETYELTNSLHGAKGKITLLTETNPTNKRSNAYVAVDLNSINIGNYVGIKITSEDGTVHAWADNINSYFSGNGVNGWTDGNGESTMGEIGGTGKRIISVGAYTTKDAFTNINGNRKSFGESENLIASYSSTGPTIDGRLKPDVVAPGSALVSSFSDAILTDLRLSPLIVKKVPGQTRDYYYGALQGTSMAAPYVTGVLATWLQAKNNLTPEEVRHVLEWTSTTDVYTGEIPEGGSYTWGYGKIDAWEGLKKCIELDKQQKLGKEYGNIEIFVSNFASRTLNIVFYTLDVLEAKLVFFNINGQRVAEKNIYAGDITQPTAVDVSEIPKGVYVVKVEGTKQKYKPKKLIFY